MCVCVCVCVRVFVALFPSFYMRACVLLGVIVLTTLTPVLGADTAV